MFCPNIVHAEVLDVIVDIVVIDRIVEEVLLEVVLVSRLVQLHELVDVG